MASSTTHIPKTMKGVLIEKTGGTEVLQYKTDLPLPEPKEGEILVKNEFIGINYIDTYFRTGLYPSPLPLILGKEAAGTVLSSPSSPHFAPGDRIVYMAPTGTYAQYTAIPTLHAIKPPPSIPLSTACASFLQALTALTLIEEAHRVEKGDWVLVLAASGGVGTWLCRVLKERGARTVATVGGEGKVGVARGYGAEVVLVEGRDDVEGRVGEVTGGKGVVAVFDGVGKETFERSLRCVRRKGTMVSFGNASGAVPPFSISKLTANNAKIVRPTLMNYIATREEYEHYANRLFEMMEANHWEPRIHETYPLEDVARAHNDLEGRKTMGKLLMTP